MSPKASDLTPDTYHQILMKGPFGMGKTIAACSFAMEGPIRLFYFDKRRPIELLTFFKKHKPELLDRITWDNYNSSNANEFLNDLIKLTKSCPYTAIIVDSVTNLTSAAVNWSLGFRDPKGGKKDKVNKESPALIPDFDEYKVETSLVTQSLDMCKTLNCHVIWIAHPIPSTKIEGSGASMTVSKVNSIVSYGSKVAGIVPGNFSEIYHFTRQMDKRIVFTDMTGDDFAKTALNLPRSFDITDKLFYEVWKPLTLEVDNAVVNADTATDAINRWKT